MTEKMDAAFQADDSAPDAVREVLASRHAGADPVRDGAGMTGQREWIARRWTEEEIELLKQCEVMDPSERTKRCRWSDEKRTCRNSRS